MTKIILENESQEIPETPTYTFTSVRVCGPENLMVESPTATADIIAVRVHQNDQDYPGKRVLALTPEGAAALIDKLTQCLMQ